MRCLYSLSLIMARVRSRLRGASAEWPPPREAPRWVLGWRPRSSGHGRPSWTWIEAVAFAVTSRVAWLGARPGLVTVTL